MNSNPGPRSIVAFKCWTTLLMTCLIASGLCGCGGDDLGNHGHQEGEHGGIIVSLGRNHYHAESVFAEGEFQLFLLGKDESEVIDVESQTVMAFLRPFGDARSRPVKLTASPQFGDAEGRTSRFIGQLPDDLPPKQLLVVIPTISIDGSRYRFSYSTTQPIMPAKVTNEKERELYLTPGGLYTQADIEANDSKTASEKFKGFMASHDTNPQPGALICPITSTVANPTCGWIIGGQEYLFCCPPCIDEFLQLAKTDPDKILPADEYVKK